MRVLFWGTPEFATAPLLALVGEGFDVVGVVTQPDKPQGRSRILAQPAVKTIALEERIPIFQPASARDTEFLETIEQLKPDISIVVAYGQLLPKRAIDTPRLGTLNIHASLLPLLRGAAPVQAAIRRGFSQTGITIMRMVPALDAGPIILTASIPILDDETYGELQLRLSELGALTLLEALALISIGEATETAQEHSLVTYATKVSREDARIDWTLGVGEICRIVRAYDPKPGAFTTMGQLDVKLFGARPVDSSEHSQVQPGRIVDVREDIMIACRDGLVCIRDVQPAGKGRMRSADWVRGRGVSMGDTLGT